jgi:hypothetical protein
LLRLLSEEVLEWVLGHKEYVLHFQIKVLLGRFEAKSFKEKVLFLLDINLETGFFRSLYQLKVLFTLHFSEIYLNLDLFKKRASSH